MVLTYNRCAEVLRTLERLYLAYRHLPVVVVDNGSSDGTVYQIGRHFGGLKVISLAQNIGAAARNAAVADVATAYVAFCDDDTWWAPGALDRAARIFDACPRLGVLSCRVLVGEAQLEDDTCRRMEHSPLRIPGSEQPALIGFMAGASIFRTAAFREINGYEEKFFIGGEEELMALDLLAHGWVIAYEKTLVVHHYPSPNRDGRLRRHMLTRNMIWLGWLRLPMACAIRRTCSGLLRMLRAGAGPRELLEVFYNFSWCIKQRKVVDRRVRLMLAEVAADADADRDS